MIRWVAAIFIALFVFYPLLPFLDRVGVGHLPGDIRFRLRSALVVPEAAVKRFHVFLIPDEGFGAILKLHDRLHAGPLEVCLRPETPYLPHITVATTADYAAARKLAASLNANDLQIDGAIDALQVERRAGDVARLVAEIPLEKGGWFG